MAEALAIIGLVASIITFVDFAKEIADRLEDYVRIAKDIPKAYSDIHVQLPLLIACLEETRKWADAGNADTKSAKAIENVVKQCDIHIRALNDILSKVYPVRGESNYRRAMRAAMSLHQDERVRLITERLRAQINDLTCLAVLRSSASRSLSVGKVRPILTVPFAQDPKFVGREEVLGALEDLFQSTSQEVHQRVALVGLGGVGKSMCAIEYSYRLHKTQPDVWIFWVSCSSAAGFRQSYEGIARTLQLPGTTNPESTIVQSVSDWLQNKENGKWLLILDNLDDPGLLREHMAASTETGNLLEYVPQSMQGNVLITSRDRTVALDLTSDESHIVEVARMKLPEAIKLFRAKLPSDKANDQDIASLAEELGCLPLAIKQAAAYISVGTTRMTITRYHEYYQKSENYQTQLLLKTYKDLTTNEGRPNSVILSWKISFDQIRVQSPAAADLLSLLSTFDRSGISIQLLQYGFGDYYGIKKGLFSNTRGRHFRLDHDPWRETLLPEDDLALEEALASLENFSLISSEVEDESYSMHRLVQLATHYWLESHGDRTRWKKTALEILYQRLPVVLGGDWTVFRLLYPHALVVTEFELDDRNSKQCIACILTAIAHYESEHSKYDQAHAQYSRAIKIWEELNSTQDSDFFTALHGLSITLRRMGKYGEAETQGLIALKGLEQELGFKDSATLEAVSNLAAIYKSQGKYERSEELYQRALKAVTHGEAKAAFFGDAEAALLDATNLAAVQLCQLVLKDRRESLGTDDPQTLAAMNDLAEAFRAKGDYEEAVKMHMVTLNKRELIFGPSHPLTLNSGSHAADAMEWENRAKDAVKLHTRVLEGRTSVLGPKHPLTLDSLSHLASALQSSYGPPAEVLKLYRKALEEKEEVLGSDHPRTLKAVKDLADFLARERKLDEAKVLYRRAMRGQIELLGLRNKSTLLVIYNLAELEEERGDLAAAEQLWQLVLDNGLAAGLDEYRVNHAAKSLLEILEKQQRFNEALKVSTSHYKALRNAGKDFSYADIDIVTRMVRYLTHENRIADAERVLRDAIEDCSRATNSMASSNASKLLLDLIGLLEHQQKYDEIESLWLARYKRCLAGPSGPYSYDILQPFEALMKIFRREERDQAITQLQTEMIEALQHTSGVDSVRVFHHLGDLIRLSISQEEDDGTFVEGLYKLRFEACEQGLENRPDIAYQLEQSRQDFEEFLIRRR